MTNKNNRKLALAKTTLKALSTADLADARGGFYQTDTVYSCPGGGAGTCSRGPTLCGG